MPIGAIRRAGSGLNVAGQKLAAVANNSANMVTEGYREVDVNGVESTEGAQVHIRRKARPGVDPVTIAVDGRIAELTYRANLVVVETADEMVGETMDLFA